MLQYVFSMTNLSSAYPDEEVYETESPTDGILNKSKCFVINFQLMRAQMGAQLKVPKTY